jgi:hypothetical protein
MNYDGIIFQSFVFIIIFYFIFLFLTSNDDDDHGGDGGIIQPTYVPSESSI